MISDLKDKQTVSLNAQIVEVYPQREVKQWKIQDIVVKDSTGSIKVTLWDSDAISPVNQGKAVDIRKARVKWDEYNKCLKLDVGRFGAFMLEDDNHIQDEPPTRVEPKITDEIKEMEETLKQPAVGLNKEQMLKLLDDIERFVKDKRQDVASM